LGLLFSPPTKEAVSSVMMVKDNGVRTLPYPTPMFDLNPPDLPNFVLTQFVQLLYAKTIEQTS
jgi:hypothetical protein